MTYEIYVPGIGQYDNIGDIILRRQLLRWLAPMGRLHVFIGEAPPGYGESLELGEGHLMYRSFAKWYGDGLKDAARGRAAYVFKPGEIQITYSGLKEHVSTLPLLMLIRARHGKVIRVGAGARGFEQGPRALMKPSLALTDLIAWRDARTADFLGVGEVMPDLAFGEGLAHPRGAEERPLLVVSMRSDRPLPSEAWFDGVRLYAASAGLEIVAVVQVERDAERARELADRLGGRYHPWAGDDHEGHENALREIYRKTSVVASDRLHVLITATTEGAAPVALLVDDSDKIERHFDAAGLPGIAVRTAGLSAEAIESALAGAGDSWPRVEKALQGARAQLEDVKARVAALLVGPDDGGDPAAGTPTVWHVGRRGEVAGGMTQVVNAYLAWPFARVRQRLLVSRNGRKGPSAYALFVTAFLRMPFLGSRDKTIVAAHLSQGGSFSREGVLLRWAARLGYPTIAHLHGSSFVDFARVRPATVTKVLRAAEIVIGLSDETVDEVRRLVPQVRVELLPNAVAEGRPAAKETIVVFGGGVTRRKGVDVLVEAWRRADPTEGWRLQIAGPVIESDLVTGLPAGVADVGALEHGALMSLLERSTIAVLPSRDEAMPMFILEALARKNAVISTTVGGIPEVLSDGAGVLVAPGDVDALARALKHLIEDADLRAKVAATGYERYAQTFSAQTVYPRVEDVWLSALR